MATRHSPILWQKEDKTVTLFDIPRSIAEAQGTENHPCIDILLSSAPLERPFASNEPKSVTARSKLSGNTVIEDLHHEYEGILRQALEDVSLCHDGPWCLDRPFFTAIEERSYQKRRWGEPSSSSNPPGLDSTSAHAEAVLSVPVATQDDKQCSLAADLTCSDCDGLGSNFHCNSSARSINLQHVSDDSFERHAFASYRVPPHTSFCLSDCSDSRSFHAGIRNQAQAHNTRRHFDFILFDPPWPNSSVKRTHRTPGAGYTILPTLKDTAKLILNTDLDMLMTDECLVGFWITNKPAVREVLLGEDGIFASWALQLEEEWIWLKTTAHGVPVTALDAMWRKPYEVLLLGRRLKPRTSSLDSGHTFHIPRRRLIIGVPDLHSRKPCLRKLIEPLLPNATNYRALEVFARHLVAGWWSWGDECIKFNEVSQWKRMEARSEGKFDGGKSKATFDS